MFSEDCTYEVQHESSETVATTGSKIASIHQGLLTPKLELCQEILLLHAEYLHTHILFHTEDCHGVNGEHESLKVRFHGPYVSDGRDQACLEGRRMCDLE